MLRRAVAAVVVGALGVWSEVAVAQGGGGAISREVSPWSVETGGEETGRITQGAVWIGEAPDGCATFAMSKASAMYRRVHGLGAVLAPRDLRVLEAMSGRRPGTGGSGGLRPDEHGERLWTVTLCDGTSAAAARTVEIVMSADGSVWARTAGRGDDEPAGEPVAMDREKLLALAEEQRWPWYAGDFAAPAAAPGEGKAAGRVAGAWVDVPRPYLCGRHVLDNQTISRRVAGGRTTRLPRADRVLEIETMSVRVPAGYSAREPAGLIVWIEAGDEGGKFPDSLAGLLDEMNIVAAGFANCGNTRPVANRWQLALDAVATVSRRWHIDPRRVYVAGLSGGGKVASTMQACFADVFTGSLPIVGLGAPENVPLGGGRAAAALYAKPQGRLLELWRQRRMAVFTGARDFNHHEINAAAQILRGEGVQAKVYSAPDMGHEAPKPERFAEGLRWVDEPWRKMRKAEVEAGEREWRAAMAKIGAEAGDSRARKPLTDVDRAVLMRVTEVAPWTGAAWRAVEWMDGGGPGSEE